MKHCRCMALLLALALCLTSTAFAYEEERTVEAPKLLTIFQSTLDEWYADDQHRALLATCTLMDVFLTRNETYINTAQTAFSLDTVFVATQDMNYGQRLVIFFLGYDDEITVYFDPAQNVMTINYSSNWNPLFDSAQMVDDYKALGIIDSYYHVPAETISAFYSAILEAMQ